MALARSRRSQTTNVWPGFVDALSSLLLVIIFLLSLFMLSQFFLGQEISGKDDAHEPAQRPDRRADRVAAARARQLHRPRIDHRHALGDAHHRHQ